MPVIEGKALEGFSAALLKAAGVPAEEARQIARSLVGSNLRGHESHGVMRIPFYISLLQEGRLKPGAKLEVLKESPSILMCDGGWGFGQVQVPRLIDLLIPKAKAGGIACGTLRCCGHIGRVGEYAETAAAAGLASLMFVNLHGTSQRVVPFGGKSPRLSTNPFCFGIPCGDEPIIMDFATSASAEGKVRVHWIAGLPIPPGWLLDNEGNPTSDPGKLYTNPPGGLLPLGGDQGHKGYGLALAIDILAGGLSRGLSIHPNPEPSRGNDGVFILIDPDHLGGAEHLLRQLRSACAHVRECPTAEGVGEILVPGEPERRKLRERARNGIPMDEGNWKQLTDLAQRFGITPPS